MGKFDLGSLGVPMGPVVSKPDNKSWLIYGPPGAGKTRLAASCSEVEALSPVLVVDFEAGSSSIENIYNGDTIDVIRPSNWEEAKAVLEALLNEDHGYKTLVLDTVGKMMDFMEKELDKKASKNKYEKWAALADNTLDFIDLLHRSGLNVIVLAHTESEKDELTGKITTAPYFLGRKTGKEGPKIFDIIGFLYVTKHPETDEPLRVLQTEGYDNIVAKDRTDTLPVQFGAPTMAKAYAYIAAGKPGKGRSTE